MTKRPNTHFDWQVYADATFAGLSVLIPLVPLDLLLERHFRWRMLRTIAKRRGVTLAVKIEQEMNSNPFSCWGCLSWPILLTFTLLKKLSKKILYFLTIKEASDMLSFYWHRAFLLDYSLQSEHLIDLESAQAAKQAITQILEETPTSPLARVAAQIVKNTRHIGRTLRGIWRRGEEDEVIDESRIILSDGWGEAQTHLEGLAQRYDMLYAEIRAEQHIRLFGEKELGTGN